MNRPTGHEVLVAAVTCLICLVLYAAAVYGWRTP